jgi:hypothetical protein
VSSGPPPSHQDEPSENQNPWETAKLFCAIYLRSTRTFD